MFPSKIFLFEDKFYNSLNAILLVRHYYIWTPKDFQNLGDNCIQIFHLGRYIVGYTVGNVVLRRRVSGAVKHDFRPHIRRYTTPNEKFEYCYPHSNVLFNYKHRKNTLFFAKRERHQRRKTRR